MRVLVAGATRVLRPAVASLVAAGHEVVALARDAVGLAEPAIVPVSVDASAAADLAAALTAAGPIDAAMVYEPVLGGRADAWSVLRGAVPGRVVRVLTSSVADTGASAFSLDDLGASETGVTRLVLGWVSDPVPRWHTPAEISAAAVTALLSGRAAVLGRLRPWSERPV